MNKPSERIVVFVTPAQKRAITSTAEGLGISVSELMRRAVLSFGATSEQVKAASIVDRLRAPREPDALNEALRKAARGTRHTQRAGTPALSAGLNSTPARELTASAADTAALNAQLHDTATAEAGLSAPQEDLQEELPPFDPATASEEDMRNAAEAVARVAAAKAAALAARPDASPDALHPAASDALRPRARLDAVNDPGDDPHVDPAQKGGRFA